MASLSYAFVSFLSVEKQTLKKHFRAKVTTMYSTYNQTNYVGMKSMREENAYAYLPLCDVKRFLLNERFLLYEYLSHQMCLKHIEKLSNEVQCKVLAQGTSEMLEVKHFAF